MKKCSKCGEEKDLTSFSKWKSVCRPCLNEYKKKWSSSNEQKLKEKERKRKYYESNREALLKKSKKYRLNNIDVCKEKDKKRYTNDPEKFKKYHKDYYELNKEIVLQKSKEYNSREEVKERRRNYEREYVKRRRKEDPFYNLKYQLRSFLSNRLKGWKSKKTEEILGCSFEEFKLYLESKFETWMNWKNRGLYNGELNYGWDLDHIIPISTAESEEDVIRLNHYTNFQPLCSYTNRYIKKDKIDE